MPQWIVPNGAPLRGVRGVYARASRQKKFAYVRTLKVRSSTEESLVTATGRVQPRVPYSIELLAAVVLSIWVAARCQPGLNRFEIVASDRFDYLSRRDDLLHEAQPREVRSQIVVLLGRVEAEREHALGLARVRELGARRVRARRELVPGQPAWRGHEEDRLRAGHGRV